MRVFSMQVVIEAMGPDEIAQHEICGTLTTLGETDEGEVLEKRMKSNHVREREYSREWSLIFLHRERVSHPVGCPSLTDDLLNTSLNPALLRSHGQCVRFTPRLLLSDSLIFLPIG